MPLNEIVKNDTYKIRCYKNNGDLDHEEYAGTLEIAQRIRTAWASKIGLRPEPSPDFAYYPTIWVKKEDGYERCLGY